MMKRICRSLLVITLLLCNLSSAVLAENNERISARRGQVISFSKSFYVGSATLQVEGYYEKK